MVFKLEEVDLGLYIPGDEWVQETLLTPGMKGEWVQVEPYDRSNKDLEKMEEGKCCLLVRARKETNLVKYITREIKTIVAQEQIRLEIVGEQMKMI